MSIESQFDTIIELSELASIGGGRFIGPDQGGSSTVSSLPFPVNQNFNGSLIPVGKTPSLETPWLMPGGGSILMPTYPRIKMHP